MRDKKGEDEKGVRERETHQHVQRDPPFQQIAGREPLSRLPAAPLRPVSRPLNMRRVGKGVREEMGEI